MVAYSGAILLLITFVFLIDRFGLVEKSMNVIKLSKDAFDVVSSTALNDEVKEAAMQAHAKTLGWLFILITFQVGFALLAPIAIAWGLDTAGILTFETIIGALLSWPLIIGGTALVVVVILLRWRKLHGI